MMYAGYHLMSKGAGVAIGGTLAASGPGVFGFIEMHLMADSSDVQFQLLQ